MNNLPSTTDTSSSIDESVQASNDNGNTLSFVVVMQEAIINRFTRTVPETVQSEQYELPSFRTSLSLQDVIDAENATNPVSRLQHWSRFAACHAIKMPLVLTALGVGYMATFKPSKQELRSKYEAVAQDVSNPQGQFVALEGLLQRSSTPAEQLKISDQMKAIDAEIVFDEFVPMERSVELLHSIAPTKEKTVGYIDADLAQAEEYYNLINTTNVTPEQKFELATKAELHLQRAMAYYTQNKIPLKPLFIEVYSSVLQILVNHSLLVGDTGLLKDYSAKMANLNPAAIIAVLPRLQDSQNFATTVVDLEATASEQLKHKEVQTTSVILQQIALKQIVQDYDAAYRLYKNAIKPDRRLYSKIDVDKVVLQQHFHDFLTDIASESLPVFMRIVKTDTVADDEFKTQLLVKVLGKQVGDIDPDLELACIEVLEGNSLLPLRNYLKVTIAKGKAATAIALNNLIAIIGVEETKKMVTFIKHS